MTPTTLNRWILMQLERDIVAGIASRGQMERYHELLAEREAKARAAADDLEWSRIGSRFRGGAA